MALSIERDLPPTLLSENFSQPFTPQGCSPFLDLLFLESSFLPPSGLCFLALALNPMVIRLKTDSSSLGCYCLETSPNLSSNPSIIFSNPRRVTSDIFATEHTLACVLEVPESEADL